jgi:anti-sigma regulatory factor (Ser/Thr protein kinase)
MYKNAPPASRARGAARSRKCARAFPGRLEQVGAARAFVAAFLDDSPVAEDAVLLTSELCANAVQYSTSGKADGTFIVRAELFDGDYVWVEVEDQGSTWDGNLETVEWPHGLYLLRQLASDCGADSGDLDADCGANDSADTGKPGRVIWFTLGFGRPSA